ncbi:peptidoglycan-binding domain-containing protein [Micavibrio aeruginosavorus]|uniref:peptidoglycan-binding domain-containing protein n=1 Tax=Micavibrio aeruginosavorus TaxID=349221 RepID=UPI003F4A91CE
MGWSLASSPGKESGKTQQKRTGIYSYFGYNQTVTTPHASALWGFLFLTAIKENNMFKNWNRQPTLTLKTPVGNNLKNDSDDVTNTKRLFSQLGFYDGDQDNGILDRKLDRAIRSFQQDNGLVIDGLMYPNGETERAVQRAFLKQDQSEPTPQKTILTNSVGNNRKNEASDVIAVQQKLSTLGYASPLKRFEPTGILDNDTVKGIRSFQRNNGLTVDGWLEPNGETEQAFNSHNKPSGFQNSNNPEDTGSTTPEQPTPPEPTGDQEGNKPEDNCDELEKIWTNTNAKLFIAKQDLTRAENEKNALGEQLQQLEELLRKETKLVGGDKGNAKAAGGVVGGAIGGAVAGPGGFAPGFSAGSNIGAY